MKTAAVTELLWPRLAWIKTPNGPRFTGANRRDEARFSEHSKAAVRVSGKRKSWAARPEARKLAFRERHAMFTHERL
jgi:hypothetical protein